MENSYKYLIRPYISNDFEACSNIFLSNVPKFFFESELKEFQDFLNTYAMEDYWVLVEKLSNNICACGGIRVRGSGVGGLSYGMVQGDLHKKGFGSIMVKFRLAQLISRPVILSVLLDTSQYNPSFFERFGFLVMETEENFYGLGLHRNAMQLDLPKEKLARRSLKIEFLNGLRGIDFQP